MYPYITAYGSQDKMDCTTYVCWGKGRMKGTAAAATVCWLVHAAYATRRQLQLASNGWLALRGRSRDTTHTYTHTPLRRRSDRSLLLLKKIRSTRPTSRKRDRRPASIYTGIPRPYSLLHASPELATLDTCIGCPCLLHTCNKQCKKSSS
jgi:hypothetical protein